MDLPAYRTARAPYPHRSEMWEPEYLYEPLPEPVNHPEFDLFGVRRMVEVTEALTDPTTRKTTEKSQEPMRARMLNEFVYCPRLFYYEQVEGVFVENADTARGSAIHEKVDRGKGALLRAKKKASAECEEPGVESQGWRVRARLSQALARLRRQRPSLRLRMRSRLWRRFIRARQ